VKGLIALAVPQFRRPSGMLGRLVGRYMARKNQQRNTWTIELLDVQPIDRILELGLGPGWAIERISQLVTSGFVAGIDHSDVMVRQASQRNAAAVREGRVRLHQGSADEIPYPDKTFDKAFAVNVHMFWHDPIATLEEIRRVLKPGGSVSIALQPKWAKTEDEVRSRGNRIVQLLEKAEFENIELRSKSMQPVTCVCAIGHKINSSYSQIRANNS